MQTQFSELIDQIQSHDDSNMDVDASIATKKDLLRRYETLSAQAHKVIDELRDDVDMQNLKLGKYNKDSDSLDSEDAYLDNLLDNRKVVLAPQDAVRLQDNLAAKRAALLARRTGKPVVALGGQNVPANVRIHILTPEGENTRMAYPLLHAPAANSHAPHLDQRPGVPALVVANLRAELSKDFTRENKSAEESNDVDDDRPIDLQRAEIPYIIES